MPFETFPTPERMLEALADERLHPPMWRGGIALVHPGTLKDVDITRLEIELARHHVTLQQDPTITPGVYQLVPRGGKVGASNLDEEHHTQRPR